MNVKRGTRNAGMTSGERPDPAAVAPGGMPTRREVIGLAVGAFLVAAFPLARRGRPTLVRRSVPVMGTVAELAVAHRDPAWAHGALSAAVAALQDTERRMTRFRPDSEVGLVNAAAGAAAVPVSVPMADVLGEALRWADWTAGRFDPCLARASALWDVTRRREPPPVEAVRRLAGRGLYRYLELERRPGGALARLAEEDAALDLGGIAKGYGVDAAAAALRDWGIRHALVGAGGDLYAIGSAPDGEPWRVGVRSPEAPDNILAVLGLEDAGLATSGDYEQSFEHAGIRYHHLLDPVTGAPVRGPHRSLTVAAESCVRADAAATALFGTPRDAAAGLLARRAPGARVVHHA